MKRRYILVVALLGITISCFFIPFQDDSIKYVRIDRVYIANQGCNYYWASMTNFSGNGPNKRIRVYYTMNNRPMVCETSPIPVIPGQQHYKTLLGCWGGDYKITRSEYID